jgi:hypothetical protein
VNGGPSSPWTLKKSKTGRPTGSYGEMFTNSNGTVYGALIDEDELFYNSDNDDRLNNRLGSITQDGINWTDGMTDSRGFANAVWRYDYGLHKGLYLRDMDVSNSDDVAITVRWQLYNSTTSWNLPNGNIDSYGNSSIHQVWIGNMTNGGLNDIARCRPPEPSGLTPDQWRLECVSFKNSSNLIVGQVPGLLYLTNDLGQTWKPLYGSIDMGGGTVIPGPVSFDPQTNRPTPDNVEETPLPTPTPTPFDEENI